MWTTNMPAQKIYLDIVENICIQYYFFFIVHYMLFNTFKMLFNLFKPLFVLLLFYCVLVQIVFKCLRSFFFFFFLRIKYVIKTNNKVELFKLYV